MDLILNRVSFKSKFDAFQILWIHELGSIEKSFKICMQKDSALKILATLIKAK